MGHGTIGAAKTIIEIYFKNQFMFNCMYVNSSIDTYSKISSIDDIKIAPFDVSKRYTKPHRHNKYLEIVYFSKGSGFHFMDSKRYDIKSPIFFIIKKEEVHHWEINTEPQGYVIIIKETFLEKTLDKQINKQLLKLAQKQKIDNIQKDPNIEYMFKTLCLEIQQSNSNIEVVEGVLKALLSKIVRYSNINNQDINTDKIDQFMQFLVDKPRNNVAFYAKKLNCTSQTLNQWCKRRYAKSASQIIAIEIIKEVKRLLMYTDKTISEIAFDLEFKDVSHFVKYFKRHTGHTPLQFKNKH